MTPSTPAPDGPAVVTLDYVLPNPNVARSRPDLFRSSVVFALTPLCGGTLVFLAWLVVRWNWGIRAGIAAVAASALIVAAGFVSLVRYLWNERRVPDVSRAALRRRTVVVVLLLLVNAPAAVAFAAATEHLASRYTVRFTNRSSRPVVGGTLTGGEVGVGIGPIGPGTTVTRHVTFVRPGRLAYALQWNGVTLNGVLAARVDRGFKGGEQTANVDVFDWGVVVK